MNTRWFYVLLYVMILAVEFKETPVRVRTKKNENVSKEKRFNDLIKIQIKSKNKTLGPLTMIENDVYDLQYKTSISCQNMCSHSYVMLVWTIPANNCAKTNRYTKHIYKYK